MSFNYLKQYYKTKSFWVIFLIWIMLGFFGVVFIVYHPIPDKISLIIMWLSLLAAGGSLSVLVLLVREVDKEKKKT